MVNNGYRTYLPGIGKIKFYKQEIPTGKIKMSRIIKKPSGWYLALWIDAEHIFTVKDTDKAVGIDPGFNTLLTLLDGTKYENPRELRKGESRQAPPQRGKRNKLAARLLEKQTNRRNDRNHKISRKLVENYKIIKYSNDNFKGLARIHGKSVSEASLGNLIDMITYKGRLGGRDVISVNSRYTTMTCSACGAKTGPRGWSGLAVRIWECSACGAVHDRDINSAVIVLNSGAGTALKEACNGLN
jgi:IS605 OrfB family transposase